MNSSVTGDDSTAFVSLVSEASDSSTCSTSNNKQQNIDTLDWIATLTSVDAARLQKLHPAPNQETISC